MQYEHFNNHRVKQESPIAAKPTWAKRYELDLSVANPDLPACEIISNRVGEYISSYTRDIREDLKEVTAQMLSRRHNFGVPCDSVALLRSAGACTAIAGQLAAQENTKVIINSPCWPYFKKNPENSGADVIQCPLTPEGNRFVLDLGSLEMAAEKGGKYFLFCNPHNPTGHVFTRDELLQISEWAIKNNIIVLSNEIYADLVLDEDRKHICIAGLNEEIANRTITFVSPTKAYNISGYQVAAAVTLNGELKKQIEALNLPEPHIFGQAAMYVAYGDPACEEWVKDLAHNFLRPHRDAVLTELEPYKQLAQVYAPEGGFFAWINFKNCQWQNPVEEIRESCSLVLAGGSDYLDGQSARLMFYTYGELLENALSGITTLLDVRAEQLGIEIVRGKRKSLQ